MILLEFEKSLGYIFLISHCKLFLFYGYSYISVRVLSFCARAR